MRSKILLIDCRRQIGLYEAGSLGGLFFLWKKMTIASFHFVGKYDIESSLLNRERKNFGLILNKEITILGSKRSEPGALFKFWALNACFSS